MKSVARFHPASAFATVLYLALSSPAAAAAQAPPAALAAAILKDADIGDCASQANVSPAAFVASAFELKPVTLKTGERLTVATGSSACVCAAQNCPTLVVLAQPGGAYRTVIAGWAIASEVEPDGSAVLTAHDSAAVSDRTVYHWTGKAYAVVRSERVDARSNTVKPMSVPLAFAAGASSATVSGKAALGFGDTYTVSAGAGQTMTLHLASTRGEVPGRITLFHGDAVVAQAGTQWSGKLAARGVYRIAVDGSGETLRPYTLTVTIR